MTNSKRPSGAQLSEFEAETLRVLAEAETVEQGQPIRFSFRDMIAEITLSILEGTDHGTPALPA